MFIVFLIFAIFFAYAESSTLAASRVTISHLLSEGDKRAHIVNNFKSNPRTFLGTVLVGTNLCIVVLSVTGAHHLLPHLGVGVTWATLIIDVLILIIAEISPKIVSLSNPTENALRVSLMLHQASKILHPLVVALTWLPSKIFNMESAFHAASSQIITESQIVHMIEKGAATGAIEESEGERAVKVFATADRTVEEIMTPKADIVYLTTGDSLRAALHTANKSGFSRLPVLTKDGEDTIGFIAAKDLLRLHKETRLDDTVDKYTRKLEIVPETKNILILLNEFRMSGDQIALVVNEHGTITGVATLEDILEEVLGEIYDEYDLSEDEVEWVRGNLVIPGSYDAEDLADRLKIKLPEGEYDTAAGLVLHLFGRIPVAGESIKIGEWSLIATHIAKNRITRIIAKRQTAQSQS